MWRANRHQRRDARTHAGNIRYGVSCVHAAHAMRQDVHPSSRRQRQDSARELVAPARDRSDGIDLWLDDYMALMPEVTGDAVEVIDE